MTLKAQSSQRALIRIDLGFGWQRPEPCQNTVEHVVIDHDELHWTFGQRPLPDYHRTQHQPFCEALTHGHDRVAEFADVCVLRFVMEKFTQDLDRLRSSDRPLP